MQGTLVNASWPKATAWPKPGTTCSVPSAASIPGPGTGAAVDELSRLILADAQTSGGLLLAVPPENAEALVADLVQRGTPAHAVVGELVAGESGRLEVLAES